MLGIAGLCLRISDGLVELPSHLYAKNLALRLEIIGIRNRIHPGKTNKGTTSRLQPKMSFLSKVFLGFLRRFLPDAVSWNQFAPKTLDNWAQALTRPSTYIKGLKSIARLNKHRKDTKKAKQRGRPATSQYIVDAILGIKRHDPGYGPGMIARIIKSQLNVYIHPDTVRKILKKHGYQPNPPGQIPPDRPEPAWKAFINNQFICAIDFKKVLDIFGNEMYILNIIHHGSRRLIWAAATYNPSSQWISQQIREAFPYDSAPDIMLMDRDQLFLPLVHYTLPHMGIQVKRIDYKCPWQKGIVERFILTLRIDLLDMIVPINETHMNRLLDKYMYFYNNVRPHMYNQDYPPAVQAPINAYYQSQDKSCKKIEAVPWVGGFHHSYRWAA